MALNPRLDDWSGRAVWVIGASSGIGRATASALYRRGARVAVSARQAAALDGFVAEHPGSLALPLDVGDREGTHAAAIQVIEQLGRLDLGQSVVIAGQACVALEAMEGTDAMLRRAAALVEGKPLRLVKGSRRRGHLLFDVPVIGPGTIATMRETGTTALAIDAARTLMLDREELLSAANAAGIAIVSDLIPA